MTKLTIRTRAALAHQRHMMRTKSFKTNELGYLRVTLIT